MMGSVGTERQAPFALWIHGPLAQDPYYILPILMGVTMFFVQKMSPTTVTNPMQQKNHDLYAVIFTVFLPVVYRQVWYCTICISNLVTVVQQQLIYRGLEKRRLRRARRKFLIR
ncbi:hypothetical protein ACNKHU_23110 [Shigella flexneri]